MARTDVSASATCAKETKRLNKFKRGMKAAQRRFFRTHRSARARARFRKHRIGAPTIEHNIQNQNFSVSGTLAPGTYEMGSGASCAADQPDTCSAAYSVTFDIDP